MLVDEFSLANYDFVTQGQQETNSEDDGDFFHATVSCDLHVYDSQYNYNILAIFRQIYLILPRKRCYSYSYTLFVSKNENLI